MSTEHDHDPNEQRLAQVLRSVDTPRAEPAPERLVQLRARSLELFAESEAPIDTAVSTSDSFSQPTSPSVPESNTKPRSRMFSFALRSVAALAAGIVLLVGWLNYQSTTASEVPFSEVLANLREAKSLELRVARDGREAAVFVRAPGLVRYEDSPERYRITAGSRLWRIDESKNMAETGDSPWYLGPEKQIDLLALLELGVSDVGPLLRANPRRQTTYDEQQALEYRVELPSQQGLLVVTAYAHPQTHQLLGIQARDPRAVNQPPLAELRLVALNAPVADEKFTVATSLSEDGRIGVVSDLQGIVVLRPMLAQRWTPLCRETILKPGDWLRTELRGANAVRVKLTSTIELILGPGTLVEFLSPTQVRLHAGETQVKLPEPAKDQKPVEFDLLAPRAGSRKFAKPGKVFVRVDKAETFVELKEPPRWLAGFEGTATNESLGSLIVNLPDGRNEPLTIGYHRVNVEIRDQIARTTIEESFVNHTNGRLEGIFHFPLPQDASISGFGMWIGNELVEADVVEKQRAREIYETILRERRDPGLLEWTSGNLFKARVFPIEPHSEKRVKITYTQVLPLRGNKYRYNYGLRSDLLTMKPLRELALNVTVNSALPLKGITCTTHPARTQLTGNSGTVEYAVQEYSPTRDFEVVCEVDNKAAEVVVVPHRRGDDGYFLVQLTPPGAEGNWQREILPEGTPLNLILLCDTSGSMDSEKRRQQSEVVATILAALSPRDRFQLAVTDVRTDWANKEPAEPTAEHVKAAREFLEQRLSLGWTNLDVAYEAAFRQAKPGTQILYIGDGLVTAGDRNPQSFVKRLAKKVSDTFTKPEDKPALHAITVGNTSELTVLRGIAANGGSVRAVNGEQTPQLVATELLNELAQPGLRDLQVEFRGVKVAALYPEQLPNIPAGTQQILVGRYLPEGRQQAGEIVVTGKRGNEAVRYVARINFADAETGNSFIPRLWGRSHLEHLLAQGTSATIREQIIALSEEFHIITPYTSLLVLESDADRERFGVKRRFELRDGERFFQDGKNNAQFELAQQQMKNAGLWRANLRREVLRQWANYGRNAQLQQLVKRSRNNQWDYQRNPYSGWNEFGANLYAGTTLMSDGTMKTARGPAAFDFDDLGEVEFERAGLAGMKEDARFGDRFAQGESKYLAEEQLSLDLGKDLSPEPAEPNSPLPYEASPAPANKPQSAEKRKENFPDDADLYFRGARELPARDDLVFDGLPALNQDLRGVNGYTDFDVDGPIGGFGGGGALGWRSIDDEERALWNGRYQSRRRVDYTQWYQQLFPELPAPPAPKLEKPVALQWPAEAVELSKLLLRGDALKKLEIGLALRRTEESFDTHWKRRTSRRESLTLLNVKSWLTKPIDPGTSAIIQTCTAKERAIYNRAFLLGQTRAAVPGDLVPPLNLEDFSQQALHEYLHSFSVKIESPAADQKLLITTNAEGNYVRRFLIDTKRGVLLKSEDENGGKLNHSNVFSDFVERGGMWWAQTIRVLGPQEELYREIKLDIQELETKKYDERFAAEQDQRDQVFFIKRPLPKLTNARKRIADGSADDTGRMVQILAYCQTQQWDLLLEQLTALEKAAADKPGVRWIRTLVLSTIRRHEEARQRLRDEVKALLAKPSRDDFQLAQALLGFLQQVNGVHEYLVEVEALRPVYERLPAEVEAVTQYQETLANALENAGRLEESLEQRRLNRVARPWDMYAQVDYARRLLNAGKADAAYSWLDQQHAAEPKLRASDLDVLDSGYAELYRQQYRWHDLVQLTSKWIDRNPEYSTAYQHHLSALVHNDQYETANKLAEAWLQLCLKPGKLTPAENARFSIAANYAGGNIYYLSVQRMDPRWEKPLTDLIRQLLPRADRVSELRSLLSPHYLQTDSADRLHGEMLDLLKAKSNELSVTQLQLFVEQVLSQRLTLSEAFQGRRQFQAHELPASFWQPLVTALRQRWVQAEDLPGENEKHALGNLLQRMYAMSFAESEYVPFLRERVKSGKEPWLPEYRATLFETLLSRPWTAAQENEAWELLLVLNNPTQPELSQLGQVALLQRWVDAMLAGRQQAAFTAKQDEGKTLETTKQELAKRQQEERERALQELAKQLTKRAEELENKKSPLANWARLETAWLWLQLDLQIDPATELAWKILDTPEIKLPDEGAIVPTQVLWQLREQSMLKQRALVMVLRLASRKAAKPALVEQVRKYLDTRIAAKDESANQWRLLKYQFLIARDEPAELEQILRGWIRETETTSRWRKSLALLLAELGKLDEAIRIYETIAAEQQLAAADWRTLAAWYTVKNRRMDQERAVDEAWLATPENQLAQQLYQARNRWLGYNNEPLPTELNAATLQAITALLTKSGNPENYFYQIRDLYQASRDFRVLQTVPRGILGRSPQQIYPYLTQVTNQLLSEIRSEAPADELLQEIKKLRDERKLTAVDARALDLLEAVVERRASEILNQPGPHVAAALAALQRAFEREWTSGEPGLMAAWLASLGKLPNPKLQEEQLREFTALAKLVPENSREQLNIVRELSKLRYWQYGQKLEAVTGFAAALRGYEQVHQNKLPHEDNHLLQDLLAMLQAQGEHAAGEKLINDHLPQAQHQMQREAFQDMLWSLYNHTLEHRGEVSLGQGPGLLQELSKYGLARINAEKTEQRRHDAVNRYVQTIDIARRNQIAGAAELLKTFLFTEMGKILPQQAAHYSATASAPLGVTRELLGPVLTLQYCLERMEQWPQWINLGWNNSWQAMGHELAQQREIAANKKLDYSFLEDRLLKLVVENLKHELRTGDVRSGYMYHRGYGWREKFPVFLEVANKLYREYKTSGRRVYYIAGYVWDSLEQRTRAIEMLLEAEDNGILDLNGLLRLVEYLRHEKRYPETIALLEKLSQRYPEAMNYRAQLIEAYHFAKRPEKARETWQAAEAHFHADGRWTDANVATLAFALRNAEMLPRAAELFQEAITLRTRAVNNRTLNDQTLSTWYQQLAHTYAQLKKTSLAVEAASGSILCWGPTHQQRTEALSTLEQVLSQAADLPEYIQQLDAETVKTGRDSPLLRKQLGKVWQKRGKYDEAVIQFRLAKELQPNDREIYEHLVQCLDALQRPDDGTRELLAQLDLNRHDLKLYEQLAERLKKDEALSERALTNIIEAAPNEAENHQALAKIREKQQRWDEAIQHWQEVAELRRLEPTGLLGLAAAQIHSKQVEAARKTLEELRKTEWPARFNDALRVLPELERQLQSSRS